MPKLVTLKDEEFHHRLKMRAVERKTSLTELVDLYLKIGFELDLSELTVAGIKRKSRDENQTPEQSLVEYYRLNDHGNS